ncbi:MAG: hypothetical protein AB7O24_32300 [Kofleriaceae bacterium]
MQLTEDARRQLAALLLGVTAIGLGLVVREAAKTQRPPASVDEPYAPSPSSAPLVSLGYRELLADLLFVRFAGYLGGGESTTSGTAAVVEAVAALDPAYPKIYETGALAVSRLNADQDAHKRAIALLEQGMKRYPSDWKLPYLAGQIYILDLESDDPAQRRAWNEKGALLLETAVRKPGAPTEAAAAAAMLRTKLGQRERAIDGLREMLLITTDDSARERLLTKLAELQNADASAIATELFEARKRFVTKWRTERPAVPETMYLLVGPRPAPGFDPYQLATGGRDLIEADPIEQLEPL